MAFQAVLFDMDGLLLDTERLVVQGFDQTVADFDLQGFSGFALGLIGLRDDACQGLIQRQLAGRVELRAFLKCLAANISGVLEDGIPLRPGVIDLLDQIAGLGLPCVVATSTQSQRAHKHLEIAGIAHYFRAVIGGDQVMRPKPDPEIYRRAAACVGADVHNCAAFEDSDPGTKAAFRSGARTVQVPDLVKPAPEMHDLGHTIAPTLLSGACVIGLLSTPS